MANYAAPGARKFVGLVCLLLFLIFYFVAATSLAPTILPEGAKLLELIYYVVCGFLWIVPAGAIIWWMQRPSNPR